MPLRAEGRELLPQLPTAGVLPELRHSLGAGCRLPGQVAFRQPSSAGGRQPHGIEPRRGSQEIQEGVLVLHEVLVRHGQRVEILHEQHLAPVVVA